MKPYLLVTAAAVVCAYGSFAEAETASTIVNVGEGVAIALPVVAGGISLYKSDDTGLVELGLNTLLTVGTTYGLSRVVREERPDGSDNHSFPSNTSALAFAPAAYLWDRYGWTYGAPAYAAASFVAFSRVDGQKHHWYDVMASAGIAWSYNEIFTTRFRGNGRFSATAYPTRGGAMVAMTYRW